MLTSPSASRSSVAPQTRIPGRLLHLYSKSRQSIDSELFADRDHGHSSC